jgi:hypothetical protein
MFGFNSLIIGDITNWYTYIYESKRNFISKQQQSLVFFLVSFQLLHSTFPVTSILNKYNITEKKCV